MIQRLLIVLVVAVLATAIIYSQSRPQPNRVSGFVEADEIRLGSRVGGRVASVFVEEGQEVAPGQTLLKLEPFDLLERERQAARTLAARDAELQQLKRGLREQEVAQAKAAYDQLQAKLDELVAGPRAQEIKAAKARLEAANAELKLAEQVHQRYLTLVQDKAVAIEEVDRSRRALDSATAMQTVYQNELQLLEIGTREEKIRAAQAAAEQAKQGWLLAAKGYRQEQIDQAQAARDAAEAALDAIRRQQEELTIKSPLAGVVDSLDLQPGDMVAANAPVISIIDHRHLWVRAYVPQNRVGLQVGQRLRVTIDGAADQALIGQVAFIARQAEFTPSNVQTVDERAKQVFRIKVLLEQGVERIRPGMAADVWLDDLSETEPAGGET